MIYVFGKHDASILSSALLSDAPCLLLFFFEVGAVERAEQMKASRQADDDMLAALLHHKKSAEEKAAYESQASVTKRSSILNIEKIKPVPYTHLPLTPILSV